MNDYKEKLRVLYNGFGCAKEMVLATCKNNRVTARTMSVVLLDEAFYFQTDKIFLKYEQMIENPFVALCVDNIQIEGMATILGHPLANNNNAFAIAFQKSYKGSFDAYSSLKNEVVVRVMPQKITLWEYENGKPYRMLFDIPKQIYSKEFYIGE